MYDIIRYGILLLVIAIVGFSLCLQNCLNCVSALCLLWKLFSRRSEALIAGVLAGNRCTLVTRLINDVNQVRKPLSGYSSVDQMVILAAGFIIATLVTQQYGLFTGEAVLSGSYFLLCCT